MLVEKLKENITYIIMIAMNFGLILFTKPIYGTTDDYILNSWLNGSYTGEIENESIFITPLFSNLISFFYKINTTISWYSIILYLISLLAILKLSNFVKKSKEIVNAVKYFIYLILISYLVWSYLGITYTSTAIISGVAGWISITEWLQSQRKTNLLQGIFLILFSIVIRPESFIGATMILVPFLILKIGVIRTKIKRLLLLFLFISSIFLINNLIEKNESTEMNEYREWAKKVQMFAGRPRMEAAAKVIGESGWTSIQYNLFVDLAYFDQNTFNDNWIDAGLAATQKINNRPEISIEKLKNIAVEFVNSTSIFVYGLVLLGFLIIISGRNIRHPFILTFSIINYVIIIVLSGLFLHNVSRVTIPFLVSMVLTTSYFLSFKLKPILMYASSIIIVILFTNYFISLNKENSDKINKSEIYRTAIVEDLGNKTIYIHGNQEYSQNTNPYLGVTKDINPNVFMVGNWDTFSPHWYKRAKKLGLEESNMVKSLLKNSRVLWSGPVIPNTTLNLINYLKEAGYGVFNPTKVGLLPNGNELWDFSVSDGENAA